MKPPKLPDAVRAFFVETGRRGGRLRAKRLTPERRKEIATKAAQTRWKARQQKPRS